MHVRHALADLNEEVPYLRLGERPAFQLLQVGLQVAAVAELHDDVEQAGVDERVEVAHEVGVVHRRHDLHLVDGVALLALGHLGDVDLLHDVRPPVRVPRHAVHLAKAAPPEQLVKPKVGQGGGGPLLHYDAAAGGLSARGETRHFFSKRNQTMQ
jgi:hypothetical protein